MSNHLHLILEPTVQSLAVGVHRFTGRYAQYFNRRHKRRGYVFQGRFRSILVEDSSYLKRLVRYIHLNPVEAGIVRKASSYRWSSLNAFIGQEEYTWLQIDRVLSRFSNNYAESITEMLRHLELTTEATQDLEDIKRTARVGVFGSEAFQELYGDPGVLNRENNVQIKDSTTYCVEELAFAVCSLTNTSLNELRGSEKRRELVQTRAIFARAVQLHPGLSLREACAFLEKDHGNISRLASKARKHIALDRVAAEIIQIT